MDEKLKKLLYKSLDNKLPLHEEIILKNALESDIELRQEKEKAEQLRKFLQENKVERFGEDFLPDLMAKINQEKNIAESNIIDADILMQYFRPVATIAALLIIVAVSYNLKSSDEVTLYSALAIEEDSIENLFDENMNLGLE